MSLETGTYISDLVPANPPTSDPIAQAANHIQLIKQVLQNTFPNVKGPVTATQENLSNGVPVGLISMWSGATIPTGWALCNGGSVPLSDGSGNVTTPDLRDRFIVGSGLSYTPGNTGGIAQNTLTVSQLPSHTHTGTTDVQGSHTHPLSDPGHSHTVPSSPGLGQGAGGANSVQQAAGIVSTSSSFTNISMAASGSHSHNVSVTATGGGAAVENRPPYYALAFIMKV